MLQWPCLLQPLAALQKLCWHCPQCPSLEAEALCHGFMVQLFPGTSDSAALWVAWSVSGYRTT